MVMLPRILSENTILLPTTQSEQLQSDSDNSLQAIINANMRIARAEVTSQSKVLHKDNIYPFQIIFQNIRYENYQ
jgi:hypothetical protein